MAEFEALLEIADDHLILGHRISEWCGHAPMLEEDLALFGEMLQGDEAKAVLAAMVNKGKG